MKNLIKVFLILTTITFALNLSVVKAQEEGPEPGTEEYCDAQQEDCYEDNPWHWFFNPTEHAAHNGGCDSSYDFCMDNLSEPQEN